MFLGVAQEEGDSRKTIVEYILCFIPFLMYPIDLFYVVVYWLNLSMPSLLISSFPESYRNPLTILVCLTIEMSMLFYYITILVIGANFALSFILTMTGAIQEEKEKIK